MNAHSGTAGYSARMAQILLDIRAVEFNADTPFTLASGLPSPTYIDCRKLISFPEFRTEAMEHLVRVIHAATGCDAFDVVAGGETAGIPFSALVADRMQLPLIYIRKRPKGYGHHARIEGVLQKGQRVLLIEDLVTDGGSKLSFVDALQEAGTSCNHVGVIFNYGIFADSLAQLTGRGIGLSALCNWWDVLTAARQLHAFDADTLHSVEAFLRDPRAWQQAQCRVAGSGAS